MAAYIKGIDVAHWEPEIDWGKVRAQGVRFAFIKATQAGFADIKFMSHWVGAKQAGILRGAYHFLDPRVDGRAQAETFLRTVTLEPGDLPPVLDLEDLPVELTGQGKPGKKGAKEAKASKGSKQGKSKPASPLATNAQFISCAEKWLKVVEAETGRNPIIYSSPAFLKDRFCGPRGAPPAWSERYTLWIANYLDHPIGENDLPLQPRGWCDWTFWQYSKSGLVDGIYNRERTQLTPVDLNFFRGSLEELYALAGAPLPEGSEDEQPEVDEDRIVTLPVDESTDSNAPPQAPALQHIIQAGDTLFALALLHQTTVEDILAINPQITNPNLIRVGDTLNIPRKNE